jgi:hypothetical protein
VAGFQVIKSGRFSVITEALAERVPLPASVAAELALRLEVA